MYKVGLTGLIGSGKSVAADYFALAGIDIIDADKISHKITLTDGTAIPFIVEAFGAEYLSPDGALDRQKMHALIFSDIREKDKLEAILHPLIFAEIVAMFGQSTSAYTVIVVPLLFKCPIYAKYMDRSIFVDCSEEIIISRVMQRSGWSKETVLAILGSQMPRLEQLSLADDVLYNNQEPQHLASQVKNLHEKYKEYGKMGTATSV